MEIKDPRLATVASAYTQKRLEMVQMQLVQRNIMPPEILEAFSKVPRHLFVPAISRQKAYADHPLHIGDGQTISQPYIVAYMLEKLQLKKSDRVLEIGGGCGYQTALLAELVEQVWSLEIRRELTVDACRRLHALGYGNIDFRQGDGFKGLPSKAPFDAIILSAAPPQIPMTLLKQLSSNGRMIAPVGNEKQHLVMVRRNGEQITLQPDLPVRFVPMTPL